MSQKQTITRPARMESLPALIEFIDAECERLGADPATAFAIRLAVEEACANVIEHGYAGSEAGPVTLSLRAEIDRFVVTVADRAAPFHPADAPPPDLTADWDDRPVGGLGWHLIKQVMDEVAYQTDASGENRLILIRYRTPVDAKG